MTKLHQASSKNNPLKILLIVLTIALISAGVYALLPDKSQNTTNQNNVSQNNNGDNANDSIEGIAINLQDGSSTTADSSAVQIEGNVVTVSKEGTYTLSGTLSNGSVVVNAPGEDVTLILNGVNITNQNGPAIVFANTKESFIVLATSSNNLLTDGTAVHSDYDAALYSVASLTLRGSGALTINGRSQEGIATENHMTFEDGVYDITSVDDGLNANQDRVSVITINGGYLSIKSGGDGIDSNGSVVINDGSIITASALTDMSGGIDADGTVTINGGMVVSTGNRNSKPVNNSKQNSLVVSFGGTKPASSKITIKNGSTNVAEFTLNKDASELIFSSQGIQDNTSYDIYINDEMFDSVTAY